MAEIVIIGNGVAGATLARRLRERGSRDRITLISSESAYFYSRPALMYIFMGHMTARDTQPYEDHTWDALDIRRVTDQVTAIDTGARRLTLRRGEPIPYDTLVLATGSRSNRFGWDGQDLDAVTGLYGLQDLDTLARYAPSTRAAAIVGGGLIGVELAEMLVSRGIRVHFLVRENAFWNVVLPREEAELIGRHIREQHVDLRLGTELRAILPDPAGRARAVRTSTGDELPVQLVGLTAGVSPNIALVADTPIATDRGILVDDTLQTTVPGVYAIGDCSQMLTPAAGRRAVEPVWYTGKIQAETLAATLTGAVTPYTPGIWYNSAKFFHIEYQTYGSVPATFPATHASLYWQDPAPGAQRAFRIAYRRDTGAVTGFTLLGIRGRHAVCESWIARQTPVRQVLADLGALNFDPEFFRRFEPDVVAAWNREHPDAPVTLATGKGLFSTVMRQLRRRRSA